MIREAIERLVGGKSLTENEAAAVMAEIMTGEATPAQLAAFLTALRLKGETGEEIAGMATVMRERAIRVKAAGPLLDTCGTGGDARHTFNVSTAAALVAAGAGARIAKHGNRAMSSHCGSADLLEALGVAISLGADDVATCIDEAGIGFMFAQTYHPSMKHAAPVRREIGIRTVFNVLGPLTNPAGAEYQVLGVARPDLAPKMVEALRRLGTRRALVVHGDDADDEVSLATSTMIHELTPNGVREYRFAPEDADIKRAPVEAIRGGTPEENAAHTRGVLEGRPGPYRDVTVLNAAAGLIAVEMASGWDEAIALAQRSIDSGEAGRTLERFIETSTRLAGAGAG